MPKDKTEDNDKPRTLDSLPDTEYVPSHLMGLNRALVVGGIPMGRIIELYGEFSGGKSTFCMELVAHFQKSGHKCLYVDMERSMDKLYAVKLGVITKDLYFEQPDNGEEALKLIGERIEKEKVKLIIVDSIAALVPQAFKEADPGDRMMGVQAQMITRALKVLNIDLANAGATAVCVNQITMKMTGYGDPRDTPGGKALKHFASVRMELNRREWIKDGDKIIGQRNRIFVSKNKVGEAFRTMEYDFYHGKGSCLLGDLVDSALDIGIITKKGAWYYWSDNRLAQGREGVKEALVEDAEFMKGIKELVDKSKQ